MLVGQAGNFEDAASAFAGALKVKDSAEGLDPHPPCVQVDPDHRLFAHDLNIKLSKSYIGAKNGADAITACDAALQVVSGVLCGVLRGLRGEW